MTDSGYDADLDRMLSDAGSEWRTSLPAGSDPYPELKRRATHPRAITSRSILTSFAGVLALIAVAVLVVVSLPQSGGPASVTAAPSASPSPMPTQPPGYIDPTRAADLISKCPVIGDIAYYFVIPPGEGFGTVFPHAGRAPELEGVDQPFVVVYDGDVQIGGLTGVPGASRPSYYSGVVCVVLASGEPNVYSDVSQQGMALPPGAQSGRPQATANSSPTPPPTAMPNPTSSSPTEPPIPFPTGYTATIAAGLHPTWTPAVAASRAMQSLLRGEEAAPHLVAEPRIISVAAMAGKDVPDKYSGPFPGVPVVWVVQCQGTFYETKAGWPEPVFGSQGYFVFDESGNPIGFGFSAVWPSPQPT